MGNDATGLPETGISVGAGSDGTGFGVRVGVDDWTGAGCVLAVAGFGGETGVFGKDVAVVVQAERTTAEKPANMQ